MKPESAVCRGKKSGGSCGGGGAELCGSRRHHSPTIAVLRPQLAGRDLPWEVSAGSLEM